MVLLDREPGKALRVLRSPVRREADSACNWDGWRSAQLVTFYCGEHCRGQTGTTRITNQAPA